MHAAVSDYSYAANGRANTDKEVNCGAITRPKLKTILKPRNVVRASLFSFVFQFVEKAPGAQSSL